MLIEDDELVRNYLDQLLTKNAWTTISVGTGDAGLSQLQAFEFDLILSDLDLGPGPNALDVLSRMPQINRDKPFVILTGHGSTARCRAAFLLGARDFLEKPLGPVLLVATLDRIFLEGAASLIDVAPEDPVCDQLDDAVGAAHVRRTIKVIERRFAEIDLGVAELAHEVRLSPEYLSRLFQARLGRTTLDYLHHFRISRAEELLAVTSLSVYEIARECGYRASSEFGSWFRRLRGSTATDFRSK